MRGWPPARDKGRIMLDGGSAVQGQPPGSAPLAGRRRAGGLSTVPNWVRYARHPLPVPGRRTRAPKASAAGWDPNVLPPLAACQRCRGTEDRARSTVKVEANNLGPQPAGVVVTQSWLTWLRESARPSSIGPLRTGRRVDGWPSPINSQPVRSTGSTDWHRRVSGRME
jgi:hypothetical protein